MSRKERTAGGSAREIAADRRRDRIFNSLHDCIITNGYARTSLADIARRAKMSPSHLLYYFPGKDAVLADYFAHMTERIIARLDSFRGELPERQIEMIAKLFFAGRGITKSEIGFMLECFGVAVHDRTLLLQKAELDRYCKGYLRELFEQAPCGPAHAADSAEIAYAMLVGLRTAAYFDERLGPERALDIFRNEMLKIANNTDVNARRGRTAASSGSTRRVRCRPNAQRV